MIRSILVALSLSVAGPAIAGPGPIPAQYFCAANPVECRGGGAAEIKLTAEAMAALEAVNARVNRAITPQREALDNWAINPAAGDCEDYALTKRAALVRAGFPASALRIAIGKTGSGESHAVLLVMTGQGALVLDNLAAAIRPLARSGMRLSQVSGASLFDWGRL